MAMAVGFLLFLVGDIWFAVNGNMESNDYIELIWIAGYTSLAFGVLEDYFHLSSVQAKILARLKQRG
jgi:hypothetical protein